MSDTKREDKIEKPKLKFLDFEKMYKRLTLVHLITAIGMFASFYVLGQFIVPMLIAETIGVGLFYLYIGGLALVWTLVFKFINRLTLQDMLVKTEKRGG